MCRSRRELSNEYLPAKFGFDTAENEPSKVRALRNLNLNVKTSKPLFAAQTTLLGFLKGIIRALFEEDQVLPDGPGLTALIGEREAEIERLQKQLAAIFLGFIRDARNTLS